jgi:hypothetical protein
MRWLPEMMRGTLRQLVVAAAVVYASGHAMAQERSDVPTGKMLDTLAGNAIVARVGPAEITAKEFLYGYLFGPSFVKKRPDSRRRYLEFMIREKVLAFGERARGGMRDPRVLANLDAVEGDLATEELYREDVLSGIRITDEEVAAAAAKQKVEVTVRWLYAPERKTADSLARRLQAGETFDTLFQKLCAGGVPCEDRSMTVTMMALMKRNAAMARIVEQLPVGMASDVITVPDGQYIMQVDSVWTNAITTGSAEAEARSDAQRWLTQQRADSLSGVYVQKMMLESDPIIERRTFDILRAYLGTMVLADATFNAWGLADRFHGEADSVEYRDPGKYERSTLVQTRSGALTLGMFLAWYRLREPNLKLRLVSPQSFFVSLEEIVWRMVRDELLVRRARARGLHERPGVVAQRRWWEDKLLFQVAKDSLSRTITWTDTTLRAYFDKHPRLHRDATGKARRFEEAKDDVLREWYDMALTERIFHRLTVLKDRYPVSIDEAALRRVPVDAEQDPRAIDVVVAKKGGTFPRPAYPTIDAFWQTWQ